MTIERQMYSKYFNISLEFEIFHSLMSNLENLVVQSLPKPPKYSVYTEYTEWKLQSPTQSVVLFSKIRDHHERRRWLLNDNCIPNISNISRIV